MSETLGKVLEIPDNVVTKINDVVDGINRIEKAANSMASTVSSAYKELGGSGLSEFIKATKALQGNRIIDTAQLRDANTQAEKLASNIGAVANAVSKRSQSLGVTQELQKTIEKYQELQAQVDAYNKKKSLGQDTKLDDIRITKVKEELATLLKILSVLGEQNKKRKEHLDYLTRISSEQKSSSHVLKQMSSFYKEQERLAKEQQRLANKQADSFAGTPTGALYLANEAQTYAQKVQAIKNLEAAYKNLGSTEEDVAQKQKISKALRTLREDVRNANQEMGRLNGSMGGLVNWGDQLMRSLALTFSISQIRNFITSVAQVRGEFEKTEVALSSMLKSEDKANILFGKIKALALQSPFGVKQLVDTTKQLSAYQIEYEKLYDTTKRLSDVSAGLGVDVGRLVLAFGQVKAANFLRGTELRQFTETGIDMLGELAKYYSELEGRMISAGEVQERVTKRMVSFGAVEEVFMRLTDKGGLFYDMQAKQADTIAGQISNLQDSIALMKNEIGEANEGPIKGFISLLKWLTDNYEITGLAVKAAIVAISNYKIAAFNAAHGTKFWAGSIDILKTSFKSLFGPATLFLGLVELVISIWQHLGKKSKIAADANREYIDSVANISKVADEYEKVNNAIKEANESEEEFAKRTFDAKRVSLEKMLETLSNYGIAQGTVGIPTDITDENIDEAMKTATEATERAAAVSRGLRIEINEMKNSFEGLLGVNIFGDDIETDAKQAAQAYLGLQTAVEKNIDAVKKLAKGSYYASKFEKKDGEDLAQYYSRVGTEVSRYFTILEFAAKKEGEASEGFISSVKEIADATGSFIATQNNLFAEYDKVIERTYGSTEQFAKKLQEQDPIAIQFYGQLNRELTNQDVQGWANSFEGFYIPAYLNIQFSAPDVDGDGPGLTDWRKRVSDVIKEFSETEPRLNISGLSDKDLQKMSDATQAVDLLRKAYSSAKKTIEDYDAGAKSVTKGAVEDARVQLRLLEEVANRLDISLEKINDKKKKPKGDISYFNELISTIKKAGKEYEEFLKIRGATASADKTKEAFENLISGLATDVGLDGASFVASMTFDTSGIETALRIVAQRAAEVGNKEAKRAAETAIAELQNEGLNLKVKLEIENAGRALEDAFGKLQLGEEFKKLGLGGNIISRVFGIDTFSIADVRSKLNELANELRDENGNLGKDQSDFIEKWTKKLQDEERKVWINTFKEYSKYLKSGVSEAVKIRLEEVSALEAINRLRLSNLDITKAEIELMRQGVKRDTEKKLAVAEWDVFTNTPLYIRLFEDLESASTGALESMKSKLDGMKESLGSLSPEVLKSIMDQYNQLEDQLIQRAPFKSLRESLKEVNELKRQGLTLDNLTLQLEEQQKALATLESARAQEQEMISLGFELHESESIEETDRLIAKKNEDIQTTLKQMNAYRKVNESLQATSQRMSLISQIGNQFLDSTTAAIEAFGGEVDDSTKAVMDFLGSMLTLVAQIPSFVASIIAAGLEINSALGIIGLIAMAVQALVAAFTMFSKIHDNKKEKQIERELELIDALGKKYEKLEKQIENAYSMNTYEESVDDAIINLQKQNDALSRAIAAESEKKNVDDDRIKEWREQQQKNLEAIEELKEKTLEAYGGFGTGDNLKSAAEDFASAWVDAFNETGDGLSGLEEQMDQFLDNAIKKQLLMRLSEEFISPLISQFDEMFKEYSDGGRGLTKEELDAWKRLYEKNSKEFDEKASAYMDALGMTPSGMDSELSGLQRGIQGVTESTAQALEALLNSIRFYTSDSNSMIRQLYNAIGSADEGMNPILAELRSQTRIISAIHDLIRSTTQSVGGSGNAMKVVIV